MVRNLCLSNRPVNALSHALRTALAAALTAAAGDPAVIAVVLTGAQGVFSGGLEPAAMGLPQQAPTVADLAEMIGASDKPVVAALQGLTLSAAADLVLAAHARVAGTDLRIGWREAALGLLPCAGATQRLPQLVGAEVAIRLLRGGALLGAEQALAVGLVDQVALGDVVAAAVALLPKVRAGQRQPGLRDARGYQAALVAARVGADAGLLRLIDCVAAAQVLPLAQGLLFEAAAAADMAASPRAGALRHAMLADLRLGGPVPGMVAARHIGLWATDALALPALRAGMTVTIADTDRAALVARLEKLALAQEAEVQAGRMTPAAREADWVRVVPATEPPVADVVIAAADGAGDHALRLGTDVLLSAPGVAEVQVSGGGDAAVAVATLRRMGLRVAITRPGIGVVATLKGAVAQALRAMVAQGVAGAALTAGVPGWLRMDVPVATGHVVMDPAEVEARIMGALVAAGARMLMTGQVTAASDIDALALAGLQMPRDLGGPMYAADRQGLLIVRRDLTMWAQGDAVWQPVALFDDLIAQGRGFGDGSVAR